MKRREAINIVQGARQYFTAGNPIWDAEKVDEAMKMAIEALQAEAVQEAVPTVVRVTMSDGNQYYLEHERDAIQADAVMRDATAEERASVQRYIDSISTETVQVVRCKDCIRNNDGNLCDIAYYINEDGDGFCNCGERKEPHGFTADEWYRDTFGENNGK